MDKEADMIRHQMEETRAALTDKVETLEQQVKQTVQSATDVVVTMRESVQDTVEAVKETFDLRLQVERHPWTMLCGAAAVGFLGGRLLEGIRAVSPSAPGNPAPPFSNVAGSTLSESAHKQQRQRASRPGWLESSGLEEEWTKLKGLAITTLGGIIGEMVVQAAPPALKDQIKEVVDGITEKVGGKPLKEPLFPSPQYEPSPQNKGNGKQRQESSSSYGGGSRDFGDRMDRFDI